MVDPSNLFVREERPAFKLPIGLCEVSSEADACAIAALPALIEAAERVVNNWGQSNADEDVRRLRKVLEIARSLDE